MYESIRGKLIFSSPIYVVVEANGIGFKLLIPLRQFECMPKLGEHAFFFTAFVVREAFHSLFGFLHKEERDLFEFLITLSGIGPKTALGIIGHLDLSELEAAVREENMKTLSQVPGIGKKTAERLILDLRGKLDRFVPESKKSKLGSKMQDAIQALIHLGYSEQIAEKAIKKAQEGVSEESDLSTLIGAALKTSLRK